MFHIPILAHIASIFINACKAGLNRCVETIHLIHTRNHSASKYVERWKLNVSTIKKTVKDDLNVKFFNICFTRKYINLASLHTRIWFLFHVEWFYVEQGTLGIKNGPVSKFNEISKIAQQLFTCFRTLNYIQMY